MLPIDYLYLCRSFRVLLKETKKQPPPSKNNIHKLNLQPFGAIFSPTCPLSHGVRLMRESKQSSSREPPYQAPRETPAPFSVHKQ